jgi:hypothetical protein
LKLRPTLGPKCMGSCAWTAKEADTKVVSKSKRFMAEGMSVKQKSQPLKSGWL